MIKQIIVDGNNLLHKVPQYKNVVEKDNDNVRLALAESVRSRLGNKAKLIIFFDGHGRSSNSLIFSGSRTADDLMRSYIESYTDHKQLQVVSSDTNISSLAKACGSKVSTSEGFWKEIDKASGVTKDKNINQLFIYDDNAEEKPKGLSKKDLNEFRKYFT